jgi:dCMP deaminase
VLQLRPARENEILFLGVEWNQVRILVGVKKMKSWDETFLEVAQLFAERSTCVKRQVGAILVKDKRILSTGYNGTPSGLCNCNEVFCSGKDKEGFFPSFVKGFTHHEFAEKFEIHAEQNCIAFAAKNGINTEDCTMYVTVAPCAQCAKLIIAAGIKKVIYKEPYKNEDGISLLKISGIETIFLS